MKMSRIAITVLGAALLVSASAFAKDTNKGTLRIDDRVTVAGTQLNPGNYKVEWSGNAPDVQVTISQGSRTVTTFPAHLTEQATANTADAYGSSNQNGGKTLTTIYLAGKHYSLDVEPNTTNAAK